MSKPDSEPNEVDALMRLRVLIAFWGGILLVIIVYSLLLFDLV